MKTCASFNILYENNSLYTAKDIKNRDFQKSKSTGES